MGCPVCWLSAITKLASGAGATALLIAKKKQIKKKNIKSGKNQKNR